MNELIVELGEDSYPIFIGHGTLSLLPEKLHELKAPERFVVITDSEVDALYGIDFLNDLQAAGLEAIKCVVTAGEASKRLEIYDCVITQMLEKRVGRDWGVIALGGGVVGDLAGFVAATFMRGLPFFQVPTSLLAQVDASVGGKVGINHPLGKNLIGAFYQPKLVWIDTAVLQTLPERQIVAGFAEIVKHGIIFDERLFRFCEQRLDDVLNLEADVMQELISRSCAIKADIVRQDEKEHGVRALLNFGHTIGHGLEASFSYGGILHGEAVFWGMLIEANIARRMRLLPSDQFDKIERFFYRIPLKTSIAGIKANELFLLMQSDKKAKNKRLRFALPVQIGAAKITDRVGDEIYRSALDEIQDKNWKA